MEQFARRPLTRRHYFPQHTAFLLREGNAKFGHGKSPSPQTTLRSEKENRPGSPCQSKIAKLLGPALLAIKGPAVPEVEQVYARARALCAQVGDTPQLFPTLGGLCMFYRNRGALSTSRELGEQLYRLAQRAAVPTHLLEAHDALA